MLLGFIAIFFSIDKFLWSFTDIRRSIILTYSYILCWIILNTRMITNVIYGLIFVYSVLINAGEVLYCMDPTTERFLALQNKISMLEQNISYYEEQAAAANRDVNEVLRAKTLCENNGKTAEWLREYAMAESALKDTNTNLNSEKRMLNILKAKFESGDYDLTKPSTGKRKLESGDYDTTSESPSSKR